MEAQNQNQNHVEEEHALLPAAKLARFTEPLVSSTLSGAMGMAPPVGLGLALGIGLGQSAFTFLQLQELEHQALILKYMVAGLPVPFHLVLPIWKSVVSSHGGVFQRHPIMLGCGNLCFDYRNNMEPEPGRCRRTDGKKWRCSKDVVPDQKYCERHMHRGRHRSRKLVEAHNTTPIIDSNIHLSISIPTGLNLNNNNSNHSSNSDKSSWNNNNGGCIASPPRLEFSPTSVFQKGYGSISETSSNSTSKTESALCFD